MLKWVVWVGCARKKLATDFADTRFHRHKLSGFFWKDRNKERLYPADTLGTGT